MPSIRQKKVSKFIQQEISSIIQSKLSDPRIHAMTTIVAVKMSNDMKKADVHISLWGSETEKRTTMNGLKSSRTFIQKELAASISSNAIPSIEFFEDDSINKSIEMGQLIEDARSGDIDHN